MTTLSTSRGTSEIRARMQSSGPHNRPKIEKAQDPHRALLRLLPYLKPFKTALWIVLASVIVYTVLGLIGPYLMGVAIDRFIAGKDPAGLGRVSLLMLVVYLLSNVFQGISNWIMAGVSQRALKQVRTDLFARLQVLSIGFFDRNPAGELMSRLTNDIENINNTLSQGIAYIFSSVILLGGALTMMLVLSPALTLLSL
ncbi:MAG: ABC transporter ATP-binding protein, partial [Chloroflexi bacterium]|nr:ABC transporter ATP-binding protein [Chloroflexota bacterium]